MQASKRSLTSLGKRPVMVPASSSRLASTSTPRHQAAPVEENTRRSHPPPPHAAASSWTSSRPSSSKKPSLYAKPDPNSYKVYRHHTPMKMTYGPPLPSFDLAYETWGTLSPAKDNVILLHTGLSASSHAASTPANSAPGWWEKFIGPGKALDTNHFHVICTNVLGGCYGSTGPSSIDPRTGERYATRFPMISIHDMVRAQFALLDHLGVDKLYASVGSSMGAQQSLAAAWAHPHRVGKLVAISGTSRSSPGSIAMRYAQRSVLMNDPKWNRGFYYDGPPPTTGMKLARQIATITYRSGPEWDQRFGRQLKQVSPEEEYLQDPSLPRIPSLTPDFLIETYLDHQGTAFEMSYDANSLIYVSKAMDMFDMTKSALTELGLMKNEPEPETTSSSRTKRPLPNNPSPYLADLAAGLARVKKIPVLILGVKSDILFPVEQQQELADALKLAGNDSVRYFEIGGNWGHDTFLLDVLNVGGAVRGFLT